MLSNRVAMLNMQAQHSANEDMWPPDQPKSFTPLVLLHHQEQRTLKQTTEMAKLIQTGNIESVTTDLSKNLNSDETVQHVLDTSIVTKNISEILTPLEEKQENSDNQKFVLIEGAPGIGKSVLLRHVAAEWGKKLVLKMFKLVLLICLRDPNIQKAVSICDLLQLFCKGDSSSPEIATAGSRYFFSNGGEDVAFLIDGYDEFPEKLQNHSLIADILKREVLPCCGIVVSSRPHASVKLRKQASILVEILGFSEKERLCYIEQSLKGQTHKIDELTQYLQLHPTISNLCFVPFNMLVLLFLYNMGITLPKSSTGMFNDFICQTICRYRAKSGLKPLRRNVNSLADLPEPYKATVKQLALLAYEGLNNNKLVFTFDEVTASCINVAVVPETINGFGLLQTVKHFGLTEDTLTFNFLHLTIQEYLAAYYVVTFVHPQEEFYLLQDKFWSDLHVKMFSFYITLTKGQRSSFKKLLCGGNSRVTISNKFLRDQLKCVRLFCCFFEAGDKEMCASIENAPIFDNKVLNLCECKSASDLESVSSFLALSSHKFWVGLNFEECYMLSRFIHHS